MARVIRAPQPAAPSHSDLGSNLPSRVASLPKPSFAHLPTLVPTTSAPSATVASKKLHKAPLSEEKLEPLRRAFKPLRFTADPNLPRERQILLSNRLIVSPAKRQIPPSVSGLQSATRRNTTPFLVQFSQSVSDETRKSLEALGISLHGYFPYNAVLAELTPAALSQLESLSVVQAVSEYLPTDKIQPFLSSLAASDSGTESIQVAIQTLISADVDCVAAAVKTAGGEVVRTIPGKQWGTVQAIVPLSSLKTLAAKGEVQWIEEYVPPALLNDHAATESHLNTTNAWNRWQLTGKGQIVGHADTGLDTGVSATIHPDFQNRIVAIIARGRVGDASDTDGHGTHTAGSILGNGSASAGQYRGMAYEAGLVHQSVMDADGYLTGLDDIYSVFEESYGYGARIHSDSWGSNTYGAYDSECRVADLFAWDNPDHLAVFACGNAGTDSNRDGIVDTGSVGSPAAAKNVVTVGASENDRPPGSGGYSSYTWGTAWPSRYPASPIRYDYISYSATTSPYRQGMAAYSSRGPTDDGRIKPDVIAPGTDILSTKSSVGGNGWGILSSNTRYCFNGGTSMATPLTAGSIALLRQYAVERGGVTNPSAALLKAMLVGGSRSLTPGQYGTGTTREIPAISPNSVEGWGQPDIANTVHPTNGMVRLFDRISPASGVTNSFAVSVVASNTPLDIALAWIDYPATAGASVTLVNDLDLLVIAPDGTVFYPNSGTARDSINTVETLRITAAQTGTYHVWVIGYNVPYSGGTAALYVRGSIDAPPVVVHTPLTAQTVESAPYSVRFLVQNLSALTNGEARLVFTTGNATTATGLWQTVSASWQGNASYLSTIPLQSVGTYVHYYLQVAENMNTVTFPVNAPASNCVFYVGSPLQFIVDGSPARFGTVSPSYGTNTVISGVSFSVCAPAAVSLSNGVRRVCSGWTGTGDVPAHGTTNAVTLNLNQDSTLTWLWDCQYALTNRFRLADSDSVFEETVAWWDAKSLASTETAINLGFVNGTPYALAGWSVDGSRWPDADSTSPNPATGIPMMGPRLAVADYLPFWQDSDANGLSDWWESRYFGSVTSGASTTDDLDGDGWTNLGEFLDNADPRDPASYPVPPAIAVSQLYPIQSARTPWTVYAEITDNLTVEVAYLVWREKNSSEWTTTAMTWVENNTYKGVIDPPSHGSECVYYYVTAGDLVGYYLPSFCSVSPVYKVIGDYDTPWMNVTPTTLGLIELSTESTNLSLTVSNFAGPDLTWTARVAYAEAPFAATNAAWVHSGNNDVWCATTNRTWNGDAVWYCGNPTTRVYPNSCHALLDTPPFAVGPGGGLLFRQWISTEHDSDNYYWDGAVIGVSTNNGTTFTTIEPTTGYPCLITSNPDSPFSGDQPCLAGNGSGWETLLLDLNAYAGQTVIVRFEFGSDAYTASEGWYVAGVTPFACDRPAAAWLKPQGTWGGVLPDQWSAPVKMTVDPSALAYDDEAFACLRFEGNDPTAAPLVPVTVRRGRTLAVSSNGPGTALTDRTFLFRNDVATVALQADAGAYLYALTVNGIPQSGTYDFSTVSRTLSFSRLAENKDICAWFTYRTWTLTVASPYGTATPSVGSYTYTHGTVIQASVTSPVFETGGLTQYFCSGWLLSGHSPKAGTAAQVAFSLTNDAALTWLWETNHFLYALADSNGSVTPPTGWYTAGQSVCVTALPASYYHCSAWLGDTDGGTIDGAFLTLPMTRPRSIIAMFEPNYTATHGVPEFWLAAHGWTTDFESAAEGDGDGDGMATWKEWRTDTDPTNTRSLLKLTGLTWTNSTLTLDWIGGMARTQIIEVATSPTGTWHSVFTNLPPTSVTNRLLLPSTHSACFYRVLVP
jgi:subtilisin family serine protease